MAVTIYHNPRCSKSRATLKLIQESGADAEAIEYLKTPPQRSELARILRGLGMSARELMRRREAPYAELGLADASLSNDALIDAMLKHPRLIERPIVENNGQYALGRPPENILDIL